MSAFSILRNLGGASGRTADHLSAGEDTATEADRLLAKGRYALLIDSDQSSTPDERTLALAWLALERDMAFVAAPNLGDESGQQAEVAAATAIPSLYMDRYAVTNTQFAKFVADDGYGQMDLWPQSIWPNLLQFVDETGHPGPRFWRQGRPPQARESHPVVGVNWFEARAYSLWSGKRLPTAAQWEHAASFCGGPDGRTNTTRYPWGNTFIANRANTWTGGPGDTVPVDSYAGGSTPNGIYQLVGNVWEWVATQYEYIPGDSNLRVAFEEPMVEIRGGAFDTYFETQATCQFRSGQPFLYRGANVGFRCCLSAHRLLDPPSMSAFE